MKLHQERKGLLISCLLFSLTLLLSTALLINTDSAYGESDRGEALFQTNCAVCHGNDGDSKGQVCFNTKIEKSGRTFKTYSRDFTVGAFKFRSTPSGCLPLEEDVLEVISNGIPKSFMPSFGDLPEQDKLAVLEHIQSLSERWDEEDPCDPIIANKPDWVGSLASVNKGREVYKSVKCWECHGEDGTGGGSKSNTLKDDWGHKIVPFDFTTGALKRGTAAEDIYMTFSTGLDGSGMPSYEDTLGEDDRWHLVSYTLKLMGR